MKEQEWAIGKPKFIRSRSILARSALAGVVLFGGSTSGSFEKSDPFDDSQFRPLTTREYQHLIADYRYEDIEFSDTPKKHSSMLYDGTFILPTPGSVMVNLVGEARLHPSVHALRVTVDGQTDYLLSLIQAPEISDSEVQLAGLQKGKHRLTVYQDPDAPLSVDKTFLEIKRPKGDSLLATIYKKSPLIAVREDDGKYDTLGQFKKDIKNDIPLMNFVQIRKKREEYLVTNTLVTSSEDGGMSASKRLREYERTSDIEWTYKYVLREGEKEPRDEFYQAAHHTQKRFRGEKLGEQPKLYIVTKNNNFGTKPTNNEKEIIFFSYPPDLLSPHLSPNDRILLLPSVQKLSEKELSREGENFLY